MSSLFTGNLSKIQFLFSITTLFRRIFMKISSNNPTSAHYVRYDPKNEQYAVEDRLVLSTQHLGNKDTCRQYSFITPSLLVPLCHMPPVCRPFRPSILSRPAHPYCLLFSVFGFPHYISVFLISMFHNTSKHYQNQTQRQICGGK